MIREGTELVSAGLINISLYKVVSLANVCIHVFKTRNFAACDIIIYEG